MTDINSIIMCKAGYWKIKVLTSLSFQTHFITKFNFFIPFICCIKSLFFKFLLSHKVCCQLVQKLRDFSIFLLPYSPVGSRPHHCYSDSLSDLVNFSSDHLPQSVVFFHPIAFPECGFLAESSSSGTQWGCQESGCVLLLVVVVAVFTGLGYTGSGDGAFAESA